MITKNPMQLKAFIKNKAAEKNLSAQLVLQNYVLERLLERISISGYRQNFILKGGFLISAIVGLNTRATMDLDTTVKGFDLTHAAIRSILKEICEIPLEDDVVFEILGTSDIREADDYPGIRANMIASYPPISVPFAVDVTTGDEITPSEIEYAFPLMFDERSISIMAYNLETILAEKLETVVSRGIANTRPRDFYDIFILWKLRGDGISPNVLKKAIEQTAKKRESLAVISRYDSILSDVLKSEQLRGFWKKYQSEFYYAADISFEATVGAAKEILEMLELS